MRIRSDNWTRINSTALNRIPCTRIFVFVNTGSDSPKKLGVEKGPAPNPPLGGGGGEAQLKYENDRLKLALAQSSANAKVNPLLDISQRLAFCPEGHPTFVLMCYTEGPY
jgi:hypothetical protein